MQDLVNHKFVLLVRMQEVNDFIRGLVNMGLVIISINDGLFGGDKLADVDGRGICVFFQVISQFLKVVVQVVSFRNLVDELLLDVKDLILQFLALSLLSVHLSS